MPSYQDILNARQAVAHLYTGGLGGDLHGFATSSPIGKAYNAYTLGVPGAVGSLVQGKNPLANTPVGSLFGVKGGGGGGGGIGSITPQNTFQAQQPGIVNTTGQGNYQEALGQGNYIGGQNDIGAALTGLQGVAGQQQTLANALQAQAAGTGPNPAQAQYQANLNNAVQAQSAATAGTRGINPAMAAQIASQQGGQTLQGATANEAALQAQQQIAAQQQLAAQQQAMAGTQGAIGGLGGTSASLGQGMTNIGATQIGNYNNALNTASLGAQGINAGIANTNTAARTGVTGGLLNAAGALGGQAINGYAQNAAHGGVIHRADGGGVANQSTGILDNILGRADAGVMPYQMGGSGGGSGSSSPGGGLFGALGGMAGKGIASLVNSMGGLSDEQLANAAGEGEASSEAMAGGDAAAEAGSLAEEAAPLILASKGGKIPAVDQKAMSLAQALMAQGGQVPGQAKQPGKDVASNDTVPTALTPGEEVLPLSVTESPDAPEKAKEFVEHLRAKAHPTYGAVLKARRELSRATDAHKAAGGMC